MKHYNRLMILFIVAFAVGMLWANLPLVLQEEEGHKLHNVEANRLLQYYAATGHISDTDLALCTSITGAEFLAPQTSPEEMRNFFDGGAYIIRTLYQGEHFSGYVKFSYDNTDPNRARFLFWQNLIFILLLAAITALMLYLKSEIIRPLHIFYELPAALSRGDFTTPVKVRKSRFFGRFLWGLDMLRETMLAQHQRALALEKEKNQTALALAHNIKTPLGAVTLCAQALREGLYSDEQKQKELLGKIEARASEIQELVQKLQKGASEPVLDLPVTDGEFYLDDLICRTESAYRWRMELTGTEFTIGPYTNPLLKGDSERAYEALCNLLENAMKYGDGQNIALHCVQEEGCLLITVTNTGRSLSPAESVHIFDSFWRGSNAQGKPGNGLGLFIARQLCVKMGGEAFVTVGEDDVRITLVLRQR